MPGTLGVMATQSTFNVPPALPGWRFPSDVPGWLAEAEGRTLSHFAAGKRVLEVGSFCGRSTICMAQVAESVTSVDHHLGDPDSGKGGTLGKLIENLKAFGVTDKVDIHCRAFADVELPPHSFDLAFIDASHDANSAQHDMWKAMQLVRAGGRIVFHDWPSSRVQEGVMRVMSREPEGTVASLAWWDTPTAQVLIGLPSREAMLRDSIQESVANATIVAHRVGITCDLSRCVQPFSVAAARNVIAADFLKRSEFTHLLYVDDDVTIPPNTITDLLALDCGVASGCIPSVRVPKDGPTYFYVQVQKRYGEWYRTWPVGVVDAEAVGGGCMMIRRDVFAALEFPYFRWPEFIRDGMACSVSDDTDFCYRVVSAGHAVRAAGSVRCGHRKSVDVGMMIPEG